ncbi:MAG: porin [Pseudomonadota bacterium]
MKRILLASTALVAFAGVAAADGHAESITFSGSVSMEYNSGGDTVDNLGTAGTSDGSFDWDGEFDVNFSQALDNGLTASADFGFEFADGGNGQGQNLESKDFTLGLESDTAGLFFGDTAFAADTHWTAAGDMEADDFSGEDGEMVLRGDVSFGAVDASVSYFYDEASNELDQLSLGLAAELGAVTVVVAYQEEIEGGITTTTTATSETYAITNSGDAVGGDLDADEVFGLAVSGSFGGADVTFAYASNETENANSTGIEIAYPIGDAVTLGAYYVSESVGDDNYGVSVDYTSGPLSVGVFYNQEQANEDYGVDVDYDLGNGATLFAGIGDGDGSDQGFYIGGAYDLGSGAEVRLVHVEADAINSDNEYFGDDDAIGTTLSLSFSF